MTRAYPALYRAHNALLLPLPDTLTFQNHHIDMYTSILFTA